MRRVISSTLAVVVLAGCSPAAQAPEPEAAGPIALTPTSCGRPADATPRVGSQIVMTPTLGAADAPDWIYTIRAAHNGVVEATTQIVLPGQRPAEGPPTAYRAGLIPVYLGEVGRRREFVFELDAVEKVRALKVGESVSLPGSERSVLQGQARTIQGQLVVTLAACGTLSIDGRAEPVHAYDVVDFRRGLTPGGEIVRHNRYRTYVSDRLGWEVANEADGGGLIASRLPRDDR